MTCFSRFSPCSQIVLATLFLAAGSAAAVPPQEPHAFPTPPVQSRNASALHAAQAFPSLHAQTPQARNAQPPTRSARIIHQIPCPQLAQGSHIPALPAASSSSSHPQPSSARRAAAPAYKPHPQPASQHGKAISAKAPQDPRQQAAPAYPNALSGKEKRETAARQAANAKDETFQTAKSGGAQIKREPHNALITVKQMDQLGGKYKLCALTFDDGPCHYTDELLDTLRQRGIHATFFMLGQNAKEQPERVRRVAAEGHEIASHTYTHKQLTRLSNEAQRAQLENAQNVFKEIGVDVHYVRPPYSSYNRTTLDEAERLGLKVALWSVDSYDWRHPLSIEGLVSSRGHDKATHGVFLFHDIHKSTVERIPLLIDHLEAAQCKFVTLSEYMAYASAQETPADSQRTPSASEPQQDLSASPGNTQTDQKPEEAATPQKQNIKPDEPDEVEEFGEEEHVAELHGPLSPMDEATESVSAQSWLIEAKKDRSLKAFFHWLFTKYWG